jgi:hypothetical protein
VSRKKLNKQLATSAKSAVAFHSWRRSASQFAKESLALGAQRFAAEVGPVIWQAAEKFTRF